MKRLSQIFAALAIVAGVALIPTTVFGQATNVTQQINGGTLTSAILDAGRSVVASPSFAMTAASFSFDCQTVTGTLGSASQRLYVINPSSGSAAWNLAFAATGPWTSGGNTYAYNDPAGTEAGCTNGQLTVNPSVGTVVNDCVSTACTTATINQGSSTAMTGATPVSIISAASGASVYRGYITGVTLSQKIPAEKPAGSYTLPVTLTATAS